MRYSMKTLLLCVVILSLVCCATVSAVENLAFTRFYPEIMFRCYIAGVEGAIATLGIFLAGYLVLRCNR